MPFNNIYTPLNIAASGTTLVKTGTGILHTITINTTTASAITLYDSLTATGTKIGTIAASVAIGSTFTFDCAFTIGLTVVLAGNSDITVNYR